MGGKRAKSVKVGGTSKQYEMAGMAKRTATTNRCHWTSRHILSGTERDP